MNEWVDRVAKAARKKEEIDVKVKLSQGERKSIVWVNICERVTGGVG